MICAAEVLTIDGRSIALVRVNLVETPSLFSGAFECTRDEAQQLMVKDVEYVMKLEDGRSGVVVLSMTVQTRKGVFFTFVGQSDLE